MQIYILLFILLLFSSCSSTLFESSGSHLPNTVVKGLTYYLQKDQIKIEITKTTIKEPIFDNCFNIRSFQESNDTYKLKNEPSIVHIIDSSHKYSISLNPQSLTQNNLEVKRSSNKAILKSLDYKSFGKLDEAINSGLKATGSILGAIVSIPSTTINKSTNQQLANKKCNKMKINAFDEYQNYAIYNDLISNKLWETISTIENQISNIHQDKTLIQEDIIETKNQEELKFSKDKIAFYDKLLLELTNKLQINITNIDMRFNIIKNNLRKVKNDEFIYYIDIEDLNSFNNPKISSNIKEMLNKIGLQIKIERLVKLEEIDKYKYNNEFKKSNTNLFPNKKDKDSFIYYRDKIPHKISIKQNDELVSSKIHDLFSSITAPSKIVINSSSAGDNVIFLSFADNGYLTSMKTNYDSSIDKYVKALNEGITGGIQNAVTSSRAIQNIQDSRTVILKSKLEDMQTKYSMLKEEIKIKGALASKDDIKQLEILSNEILAMTKLKEKMKIEQDLAISKEVSNVTAEIESLRGNNTLLEANIEILKSLQKLQDEVSKIKKDNSN